MSKKYKLLGPDGHTYESTIPGELGGNSSPNEKLYGRLDCTAANGALTRGYASHRVFFANESAAIAAGYRPCGRCMRDQYKKWNEGGTLGSSNYPWLKLPKNKKQER